ncbi:MAG: imidazoleglycerol-phosphate dehydratase HisB [Dehalococcoidia bacterium]|nr:imidazoleglycerol-phosphate dehydratase HisB [Dehalococcoidia bacterium]
MTVERHGEITRQTKETEVTAAVNIYGSGTAELATGVAFLDHLLDQLSRHSGMDITVRAVGDLHIDAHHTVEDVALTLGQAFDQALGDRSGISRFGDATVPMDEALASVAIDVSGRPYAALDISFASEKLGELPTQMIAHFLWSLALQAKFGLHARLLAGVNDHHRAEALFKALAVAMRRAFEPRAGGVPSTKGSL